MLRVRFLRYNYIRHLNLLRYRGRQKTNSPGISFVCRLNDGSQNAPIDGNHHTTESLLDILTRTVVLANL
jgi:hypothetical protein